MDNSNPITFIRIPRFNPGEVMQAMPTVIPMQSRYLHYIDGRPWKHKTRSFKTNFRSGNKKKLRQFVK